MQPSASHIYATAFVSRANPQGRPVLGKAGLHGALGSSDQPRTRLLITDDRAYPELTELLATARSGLITVFAAATRCAQLVAAQPGWTRTLATAMISRDLGGVPELALPHELTFRAVHRLPGDDRNAMPLADAVALAVLADRSMDNSPTELADYLCSLPPAFQLLAAVDSAGAVRATSGWGVFGAQAAVIFVNTHPSWQRRGVGQAMTAAALRAARDDGARQACLDSSGDGLSIYQRLGFETVSEVLRFSGPR